jgi:acyl carrier protein
MIEFLGRVDHQVKIRGFRIETGEIESILGSLAWVRDVAVLAREDIPGEKRLVAYMVASEEDRLPVAEVKTFLRSRLPEFMVPSHFVFLDSFPLTSNNKVDRRALPPPEGGMGVREVEFVAPRNEQEQQLAKIVSDLLSIEQVGVYDNFFDLGGHSLLATQFISRVRDTFGTEMPLRVLFEKPTVAELAMEIDILKASSAPAAAPPAIRRVSRESARKKRSDLKQ